MVICCYSETKHQWNKQELIDKLIFLPEILREQALRKRRWIDQQLSISGKILLLKVLQERNSEYALDELKYNDYHRPYFESGLDFNIAHSGNMVICCGTDVGQVGIDIELVKEINLADYTDYFTPNEWKLINGYQNKYDGFYNFWTRKEAVLKAIGSGFHTPLASVDVSEESLVYDGVAYHIKPLIINTGYKCHIATTCVASDLILKQVTI